MRVGTAHGKLRQQGRAAGAVHSLVFEQPGRGDAQVEIVFQGGFDGRRQDGVTELLPPARRR
jgi:hypothetical protein